MGRSTVHIRDEVSPMCIGKRAWAESQETYWILYTALLPASFVALSKLFKFFAFYLSSSSSKILWFQVDIWALIPLELSFPLFEYCCE